MRQIPHHQTNLICSTKSTICVLVILYLCSIYLDVDMNFRKLGRLKLGMFLIKDPYICSITLREFMYLAENMEMFLCSIYAFRKLGSLIKNIYGSKFTEIHINI